MMLFAAILLGTALYCAMYVVHCFQRKHILPGVAGLFLTALPLVCGAILLWFR